jgi:hypothetical protein
VRPWRQEWTGAGRGSVREIILSQIARPNDETVAVAALPGFLGPWRARSARSLHLRLDSAITRQSTALTSGDYLRIIGTRRRRAIYCEPMASNIRLEDSIVLRHSILCSAPMLCSKVCSVG